MPGAILDGRGSQHAVRLLATFTLNGALNCVSALLSITYSPDYLSYDFGPSHPFAPNRWKALSELLIKQGPASTWGEPEFFDEGEILRTHSNSFVEAVKTASAGFPGTHGAGFGLGSTDVPNFHGMHEAAASVANGTMTAASILAKGHARRVLQLGGGLHHAMADRAAGFCIYNDVAMAIRILRDQGLRVAYVDIDVHHGDGVQTIFYSDPDVLTISLHEDGRFLFPGTGFVEERGGGKGVGSVVNIPLYPGTGDAGYLNAFDQVVPQVIHDFNPDVIVVEAGADAHALDPLASMMLSTRGFAALIDRLLGLADAHTNGRIMATLGGGYHFETTIRQWAILAYQLAGASLPSHIDSDWKEKWEKQTGAPICSTFHDPEEVAAVGLEQRPVPERENKGMLSALKRTLESVRR